MHHTTDRIAHTTAFVTTVVEHWLEREIAQWVHPIKDWSDDPSHHERTLLPRSYISLPPPPQKKQPPLLTLNSESEFIRSSSSRVAVDVLCTGGVLTALGEGLYTCWPDPGTTGELNKDKQFISVVALITTTTTTTTTTIIMFSKT